MKPQRKYRLGTVRGGGGGGVGGGGEGRWLNRFYNASVVTLICRLNRHPQLPPRFTQFSLLLGSHGGLIAHGKQLKSMKRL